MLHLDAERLAALADHPPTPDEAGHLAACTACAREVEAHVRLLATAMRVANVPLDAPLHSWGVLAESLRGAGVIRDSEPWYGRRLLRSRARPYLRAAAALVIAAGGVAVGRFTAVPATAVATQAAPTTTANAQLAANSGVTTMDGKPIVSLTDALRVMQRAENDYRIAAAFIAAHDSAYGRGDPDRYRARLAALDKVSDAALQAVNASPGDPVLGQYLASARSAREVTLRQLNNTLPAGVSLASY